MQHHHRRRKRSSLLKTIASVFGFVLATTLILVGIVVIGDQYKTGDEADMVGTLDDRFGTVVETRTFNGRNWSYRDRDLTNILLLGRDWDADRAGETPWRYDGQADFLLLVTLDKANETVQLLQIDRDTMSDIRIFGPFGDFAGQRTSQICLSYAYGDTPRENCENVVWAVQEFLGGIPVDAYIVLDIPSMAIINDAIGGVTVSLEDDFSHLDPAMVKGKTMRLVGNQVEVYLRSRLGVGDGTNASRMNRQRTYLNEAMHIFTQRLSEDMNFAGNLFDQLSTQMMTNAERGWLINRAYESSKYEVSKIRTIAGRHQVGESGFMEFWPDQNALEELLVSLYYK